MVWLSGFFGRFAILADLLIFCAIGILQGGFGADAFTSSPMNLTSFICRIVTLFSALGACHCSGPLRGIGLD